MSAPKAIEPLTIKMSEEFATWLAGLKDFTARAKIQKCLNQAADGNLGDHHANRGGVSEMRIHYGPGYRLYYTMRGLVILILLCGGTKKDQNRDVDRAIEISKEV